MSKEFKDTTVGKLLDRFGSTGEIGVMSHSVETKSLLIMGGIIIFTGVALMALKKYVFK